MLIIAGKYKMAAIKDATSYSITPNPPAIDANDEFRRKNKLTLKDEIYNERDNMLNDFLINHVSSKTVDMLITK